MDLSLSSRLVVATVHHPLDLAWLTRRLDLGEPLPADVLEFRLDTLLSHDSGSVEAALRLLPRLSPAIPVLATARCAEEGGSTPLEAEVRRDLLLQAIEAGAAAIDVEARSLRALHEAVSAAQARNVAVVASYHDFEATPPFYRMREQIERAVEAKATVAKIAARVEAMIGLFSLVSLFQQPWPILVSAMGMGGLGKLSRLVLARSGSVLNYGYLREPNAPGQWPAGELRRLLGEL